MNIQRRGARTPIRHIPTVPEMGLHHLSTRQQTRRGLIASPCHPRTVPPDTPGIEADQHEWTGQAMSCHIAEPLTREARTDERVWGHRQRPPNLTHNPRQTQSQMPGHPSQSPGTSVARMRGAYQSASCSAAASHTLGRASGHQSWEQQMSGVSISAHVLQKMRAGHTGPIATLPKRAIATSKVLVENKIAESAKSGEDRGVSSDRHLQITSPPPVRPFQDWG